LKVENKSVKFNTKKEKAVHMILKDFLIVLIFLK